MEKTLALDVSGQTGNVYNETVYRPKDHTIRQQKRRRMVFIAIIAILFTILLIIIIAVSVTKTSKPKQALVMYPIATDDIIRFTQGQEESASEYNYSLSRLLEEYKNQEKLLKDKLHNCSDNTRPPPNTDMACNVDYTVLEELKSQQFGYDEGQPIIVLQLTPPEGWTPTLYKNTSQDKIWSTVDEGVLSTDHVPVVCHGVNDADVDDIGKLKITPPHGFPAKYFPFKEQSAYMSPFVVVQFMTPMQGILISVRCRLIDPAISRDQRGIFEKTLYLEVN